METVLGIDLGSTNSAVAFLHPRTREAEIVPAFTGLGALFRSEVDGYAFRKYEIADSLEIATALLKFLKQEAEQATETKVVGANLAIPDNYQPPQRQALEQAAREAGFRQIQLVENSLCTLLAHNALGHDRLLLLVHLGSSNLEVSLCQVQAGAMQRLDYAHEGLGGRDWDFLLSHELLQQKIQLDAGALERSKIDLSTRRRNSLLTRKHFEELSIPLLQRCRMRLEQVLEDRTVDAVLLAGGATRMPMLRALLEQLTGRSPLPGPNPEEVLALGAVRAESPAQLPPAPARRAEGSTVMMKPGELSQILQQLKSEAAEPLAVEEPVAAPPRARTPPAAPPPAMGWTSRAPILLGILKNCWQQESPDGRRTIWRLGKDFVEHYFSRAGYDLIFQDGEPGTGQWMSVVFHRSDGGYDIVLRSGQAPGDHYEFPWRPGHAPGPVQRRRGDQAVAEATIQSAPGAPFLILQCAEIQEQIQFDPLSLLRMDAESQRDRTMKMMPWLRMLLWFGRLQQIDAATFRNLPTSIRGFLNRPDFEQALSSVPPRALEQWVQQGFLPAELEPVAKEQAEGLLQSMVSQQALARQQPPSGGGLLASLGLAPAPPKIPQILLTLNPSSLDLLDLQVFVTIGALASVESTFDREFRKLLARRPDLQARLRSPEGQNAITNDAEVTALRARPDIVRENATKAWKSTGQVGPTPIEQGESMQRTFMMQMLTGLSFDPGVAAEKRPPWKIYKPYSG